VTSAPTTTSTTVEVTPVEPDVGDLTGWETVTITVDGQGLLVALADDSSERAQGLMGVQSLGDIDGMLFVFGQTSMTSFWMKDTLIALDIAYFGDDGTLVDSLTMVPCTEDPCPSYTPSVPYSTALETPEGSLGHLPEGTTLTIG
jgi:hypothetical protein